MYIPSLTVETTLENLKNVPDALLAGERGGIKIPEFQLGNSPLEHTSEMVQGKKDNFHQFELYSYQ